MPLNEDPGQRFQRLRRTRQNLADDFGATPQQKISQVDTLDPRFQEQQLPQQPLMDRDQQISLDQFHQRRKDQDAQNAMQDDTPEELMSPEQIAQKRALRAMIDGR